MTITNVVIQVNVNLEVNMDISSATSLPVQPVPQRSATPEKVEGKAPDGDRDDAVKNAQVVQQTSSASQVTNKLGNNLNIIA